MDLWDQYPEEIKATKRTKLGFTDEYYEWPEKIKAAFKSVEEKKKRVAEALAEEAAAKRQRR